MIAALTPEWNGRQGRRILSEDAEREVQDEASASGSADRIGHGAEDATETREPSQCDGLAFTIRLGKTYYEQGCINPGVDVSRHLGNHDEAITIEFSDGEDPVVSRIDRLANRSGGVRVIGRNHLIRDWFWEHFEQGDVVHAEVLDRNRIKLVATGEGGDQ